jgi:tRNA-modifying protein YgfZ
MRISPLRKLHQQAEGSMLAYGPAEADVLVVETFGELELEYAALRKGCVLLDWPQRGVIEVKGGERIDFLNRMLTQELKDLAAFQVRKSFWLNRKGRIDADLRVVELPGRTLLDVDIHAVARTISGLEAFVITEDVQLRDISEEMHRLALHGPTAPLLLSAVSQHVEGTPLLDLKAGQAAIVRIGSHEIVVDRDDSAGEVGLEIQAPAAAAVEIYTQLVEIGQEHNGDGESGAPATGAARYRLRPAGWHAYNIARIEAGTPLYSIDFGPSSLPHESGVLRSRVSFTKGCYLGQEVVARMESRGHSKGRVVAVRMESTGGPQIPLPIAGAHVWLTAKADGDPIGAVTSSTPSPMLGGEPIAFAMVKHEAMAAGSEVLIEAEDERIKGVVQAELAFLKRG